MTITPAGTPSEGIIRIVLVDDHALVREGIEGVLGRHSDLSVVASVGSGAEAVDVCAIQAVDVVLLELKMPEMDGNVMFCNTWQVVMPTKTWPRRLAFLPTHLKHILNAS